MRSLPKLSVCLLLCVVSRALYAADASVAADYEYSVKAGDNLGALSAELLDTPARWAAVAHYNKLPNPNFIYPRQVLHIPFAWMKDHPAQARIAAISGLVKLNGQAAQVGDVVVTGDQLETANAASARLTLPDGSILSLLEKTRLHTRVLQQKTHGEFFSAIFRLATGRIDALKKKYPEGQSPLRIEAMHGTIGVRGTHFRMAQEGDNSLAEIEQGLVGFETGAATVALALAGGQGSVADGVHTPQVITLLSAPTFPTFPDSFAPDALSFVMPPMSGAVAYRGELAKDEAFTELFVPVSANSSVINIPDLEAGTYWLRLRAIDEHGLQGLQAQTKLTVKTPIEIIPPPLAADFPVIAPYKPIIGGKHMLTGWQEMKGYQYELQMADTPDFAHPTQSFRTPNKYMNLDAPAAGQHYLRLRLLDEANHAGPWCEAVAYTTE